jgi:hypothetical protein
MCYEGSDKTIGSPLVIMFLINVFFAHYILVYLLKGTPIGY